MVASFASPIYWGLAIVGFLGLRLNQSRILLTSLLFAGCYFLSTKDNFLALWKVDSNSLRQILCVGLPLSLTLIYLIKESRFWNLRSLLRVLVAISPLGLMVLALLTFPKEFHAVIAYHFNSGTDTLVSIPDTAILTSFGFALFSYDSMDTRIRQFRYASLISIIPFLTAQYIGMSYYGSYLRTFFTILAFTIICAILLHSIITMYLERVYIDELTSIPNRRALDETLETLEGLYSIAMVDIDHFKSFNDTYGHAEGDNVLRLVAQVIHQVDRGKAFRFGGEEFCILFKGIHCFEAQEHSERVRERIARRTFYLRKSERPKHRLLLWQRSNKKIPDSKGVQVTVSIGIASPDHRKALVDDVFKAADRALYKAKREGRNIVIVDGSFLTAEPDFVTDHDDIAQL